MSYQGGVLPISGGILPISKMVHEALMLTRVVLQAINSSVAQSGNPPTDSGRALCTDAKNWGEQGQHGEAWRGATK